MVWLVGIVLAVLVAMAHISQLIVAGALAAMILVATWLSAIDLRTHRLPNPIVGAMTAAVILAVVIAGVVDQDPIRASQAVALGVAASVIFFVVNLLGGMGMGDVKYAFPLVTTLGWFGWLALATAAMATALTGAAAATAALAMGRGRKYRLPYGPFMSIGLAAGLLRVGGW